MERSRPLKSRRNHAIAIVVALILALLAVSMALAGESAEVTTADAYWWWERHAAGATPMGTTKLVRNDSGLSATYHASALPAGQAITGWIIFFNKPGECNSSPCAVPADVFNPAAEADFYPISGSVVGASGNASFAGTLRVGDLNGSGKAEIGVGTPIALTNPMGAEVVLALHSHGPALSGAELVSQLSSFTGGCEIFNGTNGFADGPDDIPSGPGECSTFHYSLHEGG